MKLHIYVAGHLLILNVDSKTLSPLRITFFITVLLHFCSSTKPKPSDEHTSFDSSGGTHVKMELRSSHFFMMIAIGLGPFLLQLQLVLGMYMVGSSIQNPKLRKQHLAVVSYI